MDHALWRSEYKVVSEDRNRRDNSMRHMQGMQVEKKHVKIT